MREEHSRSLGLDLCEVSGKDECLGPDDRVVREHHDLQPYLVERELFERELGKACVLVVTDAILDVRVRR